MSQLVLAQFADPDHLLAATRKLREALEGALETYSPFPVEGGSEALGLPRSRVPAAVLIGGLLGAGGGYAMQVFCNAVDWPIIVGNRPPHAAASFVPITFELGVLCGSFGAFFSVLGFNKLPALFHPVDRLEAFRSATTEGFWLSVERAPADPPVEKLAERLRELGAVAVSVIEGDT